MHDRFYEARDMMLMSHLQDSVSQTDIPTQILFNRAMVQIGLCAFRCGLFREAHICLQEIQSCGKTKELLAQGIAVAKDKLEDKTEKGRLLPFHMHINLELLECVYLTCAMLLEVPNIALHSQDSRRKVISKSFRRMLDYNDRQIFTGPPENSRDYIMAASKAMGMGEWSQCNFFVLNMKVWDFLSNADLVKEKLTLYIIYL
jgi:translation initiation factor 3 subunit C